MNEKLSLAYSTCPNDTFIFDAMVHGRINCGGLSFDVTLADVEKLNLDAEKGRYQISKLSFAAIGHLRENYALLGTGAALGRGCGPLIVTRPGFNLENAGPDTRIAVPGIRTTANMLLGLYLPEKPVTVPMTFDRIMPAVSSGEFDFGVIIHEGRFTFQDHGLECLVDLGSWWETETGLPIPLGGIAVRRDLPLDTARTVQEMIGRSVRFAFDNPAASKDYIRAHAQELSDEVTKQHIDLYVNSFSEDLGKEGRTAVDTLFSMAEQRGLIPAGNKPLFLT